MKTNNVLLTILFIFPLLSFSQNCNCAAHFKWVKETFSENDAGYQYAIDKKGLIAYDEHNMLFAKKVNTALDIDDCIEQMNDWLTFFRTGHLAILKTSTQQIDDQVIIEKFKNWESIAIDENEFKSYLQGKKEHNLEGIWSSGQYRIAIKKIGEEFVGIILSADGVHWTEGQVKLRISDDADMYYRKNHSKVEVKKPNVLGNTYLEIGNFRLSRTFPNLPSNASIEKYLQYIDAGVPSFKKLSEQTILLRIPSFAYSQKAIIDSLISSHAKTISKTKNLILDIRNNGGGSDLSFEKLLPYIYTNPIRSIGLEYLSTPLNNQRLQDIIDNPNWAEEDKKGAREQLRNLNNNLGKFVDIHGGRIGITKMDSIYAYPKNIGIIINSGNGSSAEQFLLSVKQSKKVKLFGTTTAGVLDIANMYRVNSPCGELQLVYGLSKTTRVPELPIDGIGIQPDYFIDDEIPNHEWISHVEDILEFR